MKKLEPDYLDPRDDDQPATIDYAGYPAELRAVLVVLGGLVVLGFGGMLMALARMP